MQQYEYYVLVPVVLVCKDVAILYTSAILRGEYPKRGKLQKIDQYMLKTKAIKSKLFGGLIVPCEHQVKKFGRAG